MMGQQGERRAFPLTRGAQRLPGHGFQEFLGRTQACIAIAAAALTSILLLIMLELTRGIDNPYADLIVFIFIPSILVFGLFVALVGALWERRRRRNMSPEQIGVLPIIDLNDPRRRRSLIVFAVSARLAA